MKKTALTALVLVLGVGAYAFWPTESQGKNEEADAAPQPPPAVEVVLETVKPGQVDVFVDLPGRTQAFKVAEIRPQVSGIVTERLFEEGSDVQEGQQLYQIDPAPYQAAYDSALADLQKAKANIQSNQSRQARYAELVKIGGVSKQEYDDTIAMLAQAKADVAIANAAVATAKINLDYTKVMSPISGRIGKSAVTEGALVTAGQAGSLAVVQQLDKIYVDVTQSIADLRKMRKSFGETATQLPARLTIEGESEPYSETGTLQFADVTVDQGTGSVSLRILFANPRYELLPGMFVKARVTQGQADNAILAPQKAVTRNADGSTTVWVAGADNKVKVQPITVTRAIGDQWLVTDGLKAGDRIVTEGIPKLSPDAVVKPAEPQAAAPGVPPGEQGLEKADEPAAGAAAESQQQ